MPTYQYQCKTCGHELEEFQSITEAPLVHCPKCNNDTLVRIIGAGGGLIFKGSGFYLTDYKKTGSPADIKPDSDKKSKKKPESSTPSKPPGSDASGDSKPPSSTKK